MRLRKNYDNFADLKKHLTSVKLKEIDTLTFYVDRLLLTANSYDSLFKKIQKIKESKFKESNDFKNIAIVRKHINYRKKHNHFVFDYVDKTRFKLVDIANNDN